MDARRTPTSKSPVKFGLLKARSTDFQKQPSTENLQHTCVHGSSSSDHVATLSSPVPSTSQSLPEDTTADLSVLSSTDSEDETNYQPLTKKMSNQNQTSIAAGKDCCGNLKKTKRNRRDEKLFRDFDMWKASNMEVMRHLLSKSGTLDEQIKWEAIATARGLCTLTDNCTCNDCRRARYLPGVMDGDAGIGDASLFSAINFGCIIL